VQAALRAIPPERFLFTPPLFDQLRALGYMLSRPAVKLSPDAVTLGFDVIRRGPKGEVVFSTKGDPAALQDLHSAVAPRGFRKTFVQWLSAGTDEYGKPLGETGYTGSTRPPPGPHATQAAIAVNAMLLHDLYDIAGRFSVLEAFERSKAEAAQGRIRGLRAQPRSSTWVGQGHDGADRRFDVGSSERVVIHHAALGLEDGALSLRANITYLGDVSISTLVRITLRVVRLSVSGSTPFVVRHASKEGLRIEIASVQVDEPTAVGVLQALGFVVGVALAPVTAGASLAIAAMAVLVVDATVDALLGNAERQAHGGLSKAAATGFGLPLDWTSIQLVPNAPVVLDLRPNDAAISTEGVFTWFELRPRLGTARLRAEDVSVQDIWPSTRLEPIVLLLEGAESLVHPEDSAVRIEWTLTVPGSSIPPPRDRVHAVSRPRPRPRGSTLLHRPPKCGAPALRPLRGELSRVPTRRGGHKRALPRQDSHPHHRPSAAREALRALGARRVLRRIHPARGRPVPRLQGHRPRRAHQSHPPDRSSAALQDG
jgi:hypothetical protein